MITSYKSVVKSNKESTTILEVSTYISELTDVVSNIETNDDKNLTKYIGEKYSS